MDNEDRMKSVEMSGGGKTLEDICKKIVMQMMEIPDMKEHLVSRMSRLGLLDRPECMYAYLEGAWDGMLKVLIKVADGTLNLKIVRQDIEKPEGEE